MRNHLVCNFDYLYHSCCSTHAALHTQGVQPMPTHYTSQTSKLQNTCAATILHAGADQSRTLVRASEFPGCSVGWQKSLTAALSGTSGNIYVLLSMTPVVILDVWMLSMIWLHCDCANVLAFGDDTTHVAACAHVLLCSVLSFKISPHVRCAC